MDIISKLFNKDKSNYNVDLRSMVLYNTHDNLIILIQYGYNDFYNAIKFIDACYKAGLNIELSYHKATEEDNSKEIKPHSPEKVIQYTFYIIVYGSTDKYAKIFDYEVISNTILKSIINDIYNSCDSVLFENLISYGVLSRNKFKYNGIRPQYDEYKTVSNPMKKDPLQYDDIKTIISRIPVSFLDLDIFKMINIYDGNRTITAYQLIDTLLNNPITSENDNAYDYNIYKILSKPLYGTVLSSEYYNDINLMSIITSPVYLKQNLEDVDYMSYDLSYDDLDQIFQQKYDRFNITTSDNMKFYKNLDENVSDTNVE